MQLNALIIDDEPLAHDIIQAYVKDIPFLNIIGNCYLATEALPVLRQQNIDLIFLDIHMPKLKGLDFLRVLKNPPIVIITSAYEEYALESFELDVCDYLHKPFRFDRFLKAANKALEWHELKNNQGQEATSKAATPPQQLFIKTDKRHMQLDLSDIYFLESYGNYVKVWLADQFHLTLRTLSSFETQLQSQANFIRIHKSYLINKTHVSYLEGNQVFMRNGQTVGIGKSYKSVIKQIIDTP